MGAVAPDSGLPAVRMHAIGPESSGDKMWVSLGRCLAPLGRTSNKAFLILSQAVGLHLGTTHLQDTECKSKIYSSAVLTVGLTMFQR